MLDMLRPVNSIALRMAQTPSSVYHSECNRVNLKRNNHILVILRKVRAFYGEQI